MLEISAKTKVFAVLGDPIAHSLSPFIQNYTAQLRNCDMVYHAMHVTPENLEAAINGGKALGIDGFNITVPHKKAVMKYLCGIDKQAEAVGAVNTLKLTENGYTGYNTDIIGAYYAFEENNIGISGKTVVVLGAGGAGNACAAMAMSRGAKKVYIANRTVDTAEALAEHLSQYYDTGSEVLSIEKVCEIEKADIVINTTVLGFADKADMTPLKDVGWYKRAGVGAVFDAIYAPWETVFVKQARACGLKALNGFSMLVYQAVAAQEIWLDSEFDKKERTKICRELTEKYIQKRGIK